MPDYGMAGPLVILSAMRLTASSMCATLDIVGVHTECMLCVHDYHPTSGGKMNSVLTGLPVIVQVCESGRPTAFWWCNRRHSVAEVLCHWAESYSSSVHWLVRTDCGKRVTLIYYRCEEQWYVDWACE